MNFILAVAHAGPIFAQIAICKGFSNFFYFTLIILIIYNYITHGFGDHKRKSNLGQNSVPFLGPSIWN